ncbi:MAG: PEGA domain-containing protein [Chitinispirillaceae bacterium]|nr:PEGA domain-containing protein [Chitinispirillaceae bacterium]
MEGERFLLPVVLCAVFAFAGDEPAAADNRGHDSFQIAPDSSLPERMGTEATAGDSLSAAVPQPLPLCTLEITTDPSGASISLDGALLGSSPLNQPDLHAGRHTLVFRKPGYFQKKAVIELQAARKTALHFQLSAPARLSVKTEPPQATVSINGEGKGTTPYTDSLIKPGTYRIALHKENYRPVEDSVTVVSGGRVEVIDTLLHTDSYRDSLQQAAAAAKIRRKRFSIGLIAGTFLTFLLVLAIIEKQD